MLTRFEDGSLVPRARQAGIGRQERGPRVVHVVPSLSPGGTERLVIELATRLAPRVPALVCCLDGPGAWAPELAARGIAVRPLHRAPGFRPLLGLEIARIVAQHGARVLHCHHYSPFVYGRIAASLVPGVRLVFTEHGRLFDARPSPKRRIANRFLGRLPARIFAVSADLRRHMVEEGFIAARIEVLPGGIDPGAPPLAADRSAAREALGLDAGVLAVGTAARLDPVKDLGTLLAAIAEVRRSCARAVLVVVGDGAERGRLEAAARALGIHGAVRFLGHRADVRRLLPGLDVYANSSVSEGVSLTILEAMAAGLPVVATRVGGNPEVVLERETGLLAPARDPMALAAALGRVLADPGRARALGEAGRLRVESRFTIDRMVAAYERVYAGLPSWGPGSRRSGPETSARGP